jgi:hypothetical protein
MRTLLRVSIPLQAGNAAILDGRLMRELQSLIEQIEPESAYFVTECGVRTALIVFDLKEPSQIVEIAEPLFIRLNAAVEFVPAMTTDDLLVGLEAAADRF